ncbi:hypothetical protein GCM10027318_23920 [Massilia agilis]
MGQVGARQRTALHALHARCLQMRQISTPRCAAALDDTLGDLFDYWVQRHDGFLECGITEILLHFFANMDFQTLAGRVGRRPAHPTVKQLPAILATGAQSYRVGWAAALPTRSGNASQTAIQACTNKV